MYAVEYIGTPYVCRRSGCEYEAHHDDGARRGLPVMPAALDCLYRAYDIASCRRAFDPVHDILIAQYVHNTAFIVCHSGLVVENSAMACANRALNDS